MVLAFAVVGTGSLPTLSETCGAAPRSTKFPSMDSADL